MIKGLRKPFFDVADGGGGDSGSPVDPIVEPTKPIVKDDSGEDLTGLKKNRDDILAENVKLKAKIKKTDDAIEAERVKGLADDGKYQEVITEKDKKIEKQNETIKSKEMKLACKDLKDPKYSKFFEDQFEFDDELNITNSEAVITKAMETNPELFKGEKEKIIPNTNIKTPVGFKPGHKFTQEEIGKMTPDQYEKNSEAIDAQLADGSL